MKIFLFFLGALIFVFTLIMIGVFIYVFVRRNNKTVDDIDSYEDSFLCTYKDVLKRGMKYIVEAEHQWVSTESFDGLKLSARFYPCVKPNKKTEKTIILFHGYRSTGSRDFCSAVQMYHENGFNVLLVDQRSHGKSEGKLITFGIKESYDAVSWVEFILDRFGETTPVFLSGLSMGASTVMIAADRNLPNNVRGIIADCGFTSPAEIISLVAARNFHVKSKLIIRILDIMCKLVGGFTIYGINTEEILAKSHIPILFFHGAADSFVPCNMSIRNHKAAIGEKKIYIVDKAEHGGSFLVEPETVSGALREFFERYGDIL